MYVKINCKKLAFTMAEVLIVLSIIGIVAEMTIPSLSKTYQQMQYATGAKKAFTNFNQVLAQMTQAYNCTNDLACTGLFASTTTTSTLGAEVVKYMKVIKNCGTGTGCWPTTENDFFDGTAATNTNVDSDTNYYKFVTADGMSWGTRNLNFSGADCSYDIDTGILGHMSKTCGAVYVDVNGMKEPNNLGKDFFVFWITNGKGPILYPRGGVDDYYSSTNWWWNNGGANYCYSSTSKDGRYCTGRLVEKGWVMDW